MKKIRNIFIEGPIDPTFVAESIAKHTIKTNIGGHSIFLGQIREDSINDKKVWSIEFTAYQEMALEKSHEIREEIITKYGLTCAHIYHSLGNINVGEICLVYFSRFGTLAGIRPAAIRNLGSDCHSYFIKI
jgi:molybdopterin synthase catalytic subunit